MLIINCYIFRHCERSEAIQAQAVQSGRLSVGRLCLDCFVVPPRNDGADGRFSSEYAALSVISRPVFANSVPPPRHCERSEAIQAQAVQSGRLSVGRLRLDCFASLAGDGAGRRCPQWLEGWSGYYIKYSFYKKNRSAVPFFISDFISRVNVNQRLLFYLIAENKHDNFFQAVILHDFWPFYMISGHFT
jgi:hypothetical protein